MKSLSSDTMHGFANEFACQRRGFALGEITPFFEEYQQGVPTPAVGIGVLKTDHFVECVTA